MKDSDVKIPESLVLTAAIVVAIFIFVFIARFNDEEKEDSILRNKEIKKECISTIDKKCKTIIVSIAVLNSCVNQMQYCIDLWKENK